MTRLRTLVLAVAMTLSAGSGAHDPYKPNAKPPWQAGNQIEACWMGESTVWCLCEIARRAFWGEVVTTEQSRKCGAWAARLLGDARMHNSGCVLNDDRTRCDPAPVLPCEWQRSPVECVWVGRVE